MPLFRRSPGAIEWADVEKFIRGRVPENVMLDYKEYRGSLTDNILNTIGAMANTYGGDILVGIAEGKDGTPAPIEKLRGVPASDSDRHKKQIEQWNLRIQPPVLGLSVESVSIPAGTGQVATDDRCVIVVRVFQSDLLPHFIAGKGHYGRAGSHNKPYDDEHLATERIIWLNNRREAHVRFRGDLVSTIDKLGRELPVAWHTCWCVPAFPSPDRPLWERLPGEELARTIPRVMAPGPSRFFSFDVARSGPGRTMQHGWVWDTARAERATWRSDYRGSLASSPFATYLVEDRGLVACKAFCDGEFRASTRVVKDQRVFDSIVFDWSAIVLRFLGVCLHGGRLYEKYGYTGSVQIGMELALSPGSPQRAVMLGLRDFERVEGCTFQPLGEVAPLDNADPMACFDRRLREDRVCLTGELQEAAKQFAVDSFWARAFNIDFGPMHMEERVEELWSYLRSRDS